MPADFFAEVETALNVLRNGGVILYPTDTVWGLGCDATNAEAVKKVYTIKERPDSKSLIILVAEERDILTYVASPDPAVFDFIQQQPKPTTVIFNDAVHLPDNVIAGDGTIAIRVVQDDFCRHLIKRLRRPVVATSANSSGQPSPGLFDEVAQEIKDRADYVVQWRQDDRTPARPSQIIKWNRDGSCQVIRK